MTFDLLHTDFHSVIHTCNVEVHKQIEQISICTGSMLIQLTPIVNVQKINQKPLNK